MEKRDLKRELSHLYLPSAKEVVAVRVPDMSFLMVDGQGDPNTSQTYADAVEALFSVSYAIKFGVKKGELGIDYTVMPLEGLWWADDMSDFVSGDRTRWQWTMMIMQPDFVAREFVDETATAVGRKKDLPALSRLRFETYVEGAAAQTLHVGPFTEEGPVIARIHDFIEHSGHELAGKHHEIYLTDIRRADPSRWKTVIRQPMR